MITVFSAREIMTMDPNLPRATHVAVKDGLVIAVGAEDCAQGWGEARHNDRFANKVIIPGLIEAHAHVAAGGVWRHVYLGHYPRTDPDGSVHNGSASYEQIVGQLREVARATPAGQPVVGWGYDPAFVPGARMDRHLLDKVSTDHPIAVFHSNFHLLTVNSMTLDVAGLDRNSNIEGVCREENGSLSGELREFLAMGPAMDATSTSFPHLSDERAVRDYGRAARNCGVTTIADLNSELDDREVAMLKSVTAEDGFPVRYNPVMAATYIDPEAAATRALELKGRSTPKLILGAAKLFTDGAIQGRTAMLKPPGYFTGADDGIWNMDMDDFRHSVRILHGAGVKIHVHANGDEATEQTIRAFEAAALAHPRGNLRHTIEHAQLAGIDQFKRMKSLGLTVNLFANHVHYFGDIHLQYSLGPDRSRRMDACADAWRVFGGDFAIHSDAPVTPLAPLGTAWCAVNRRTVDGRDMGEVQKITVAQALYCITMGAAHVLDLDGRVGSIQCGKHADFCVLDENPLAVDPTELSGIPIVATVLDGKATS